MKKQKFQLILIFLICLFLMKSNTSAQVLIPPPPPAKPGPAGTKVLFSFSQNNEEWKSYNGTVKQVQAPGVNGAGYLMLNYNLKGSGFLYDTFESPEINEDFSGFHEIRLHVLIPSSAPYGIKSEFFVKAGPDWKWISNDWNALKKGDWTTLAIPISKMSKDLRKNIRSLGIKIGIKKKYEGYAFIDRVELIRASTSGKKQ